MTESICFLVMFVSAAKDKQNSALIKHCFSLIQFILLHVQYR